MPVTKKTIYSDLFTNFDVNPVSDDIALKTNENAVKQSIRNLILTDRGERPFQPKLGGNIRQMLFENVDPQTMLVIKEQIKQMLETFEPRCSIIEVVVTPSVDNNAVAITIVFAVINKQEPVSLEVILDRVT
jgi:phage baseplate assembly protein W